MFDPEGILDISYWLCEVRVVSAAENSVHCEDLDFLIREYFHSGPMILDVYEYFLATFQPSGLHALLDEVPWHCGVWFKVKVDMHGHSDSLRVHFSSAVILWMDVVGSFAIIVLRALMKSRFPPPLPAFFWMPLPMSMVFLIFYTVRKDTPTILGCC